MTSDEPPPCDVDGIVYPSDSITLGKMRHHEPVLFTRTGINKTTLSSVEAISTLFWEHVLAEKSYAKALGMPDPHPDDPRDELRDLLDEAYRAYGVSTGRHQSLELVRGIEKQAADQARGRGLNR